MSKLLPFATSMLILTGGAALAQREPSASPATTIVTTTAAAQAGPDAQVQASRPPYTGPEIRIFGIPLRAGAPVSPPYATNAYETFAGQPMTGLDQVMSQEVTGEPLRSGAQFPAGNDP